MKSEMSGTQEMRYQEVGWNEKAVEYLGLALLSPYNSMEFIKKTKHIIRTIVLEKLSQFLVQKIHYFRVKNLVGELIKIQMFE